MAASCPPAEIRPSDAGSTACSWVGATAASVDAGLGADGSGRVGRWVEAQQGQGVVIEVERLGEGLDDAGGRDRSPPARR